MKSSIFYLALSLLLPLAVFGQRPKGVGANEEAKAYFENNILPVMKTQRLKLDNQLAKEDKARLTALRQKQEIHHQERLSLLEAVKNARENGVPLTDQEKIALYDTKEAGRAIHQEAETIAEKYETQIEALFEEIATERETWKNDMSNLTGHERGNREGHGWKDKDGDRGRDHHRKGGMKGQGEGRRGGKEMGMGHGKHLMGPVGFLLWDPTQTGSPFDEEGETIAFPNPTAANAQIRFGLKTSGNVKITLVDENGTTVKEVLEKQLTKGPHLIDVPTDGLQNGTYFYRIVSPDGTETKRLLINQ